MSILAPTALPPLSSPTPVLRFEAALLERARPVKVVFFDVDGILTDGGLYFSDQGETLKRFNTLDGHGLKLLQKAGIVPAVVTGRDSSPLRVRLAALGVTHCRFGTEDKGPAAQSILDTLGLGWHQAAAMGDDWPDLAMMRRAALALTTPHAHAEVKACAHHITQAPGGQGAVRECADLLTMASGHYAQLLAEAAA